MTLIENGTFLPGVLTEVSSDYSFGYDSSLFGTTDSVLIIGTSFTGPVGTPIRVYSPEHGRYTFGKSYDSKAKRESTLVAGIEDAYQRGARTIYAIRIAGKDVKKSFNLGIDSNFKIQVRSLTPTNEAKNFQVVYDDTPGNETIKIYKPSEFATITEKMQGAVQGGNTVLVTEVRLNRDHGMTKDAPLVDVIDTVNTHPFNNVVRLGILDEEGNDVTNVSLDVKGIKLGALYPGAYFIGRDKSSVLSETVVNHSLILTEEQAPYDGFEDVVHKELIKNTDVSMPFPIFVKDFNEFRSILADQEIFSSEPFDFLEVSGVSDRAFAKDKEDYEESDLSNFDIYQRLGSGYAITARAERREDGTGKELTPRVKESPMTDANRIHEISDGIYSMLENLNARYRVMLAGNADEAIASKLPRAKDFMVAAGVQTDILDGLLQVTPKVNPKTTFAPKSYKFRFDALDDEGTEAPIDDIFVDETFEILSFAEDASLLNGNIETGTKILVVDADTGKGTIKRAVDGRFEVINNSSLAGKIVIANFDFYQGVAGEDGVVFEKMVFTDATDARFGNKEFILGESNSRVFAHRFLGNTSTDHLTPLGDIESMLGENEEKTTVYALNKAYQENPVIVSSAIFEGTTVEELKDYLNAHPVLTDIFEFDLTAKGFQEKDEYVSDIAGHMFGAYEGALEEDRIYLYDYNKYIPYKTADNFARQLAQHCTYTSLKTVPTHGLIGLSRLSNLTLDSVAKRVDEVSEMEFDLYAKTASGRNMLDRNNMPYPIGKNISIPFMQYAVNMADGYRYISTGAAGYAGMVSQLPLDQSSTAQPIAISNAMYDLTNYQLSKLTQRGIVTLKQSFTRGLVITDGITQAPAESPFKRLSTTRVIGGVEDLIREAVEPFIGKQHSIANRNSMQTAIRSQLETIKDRLIENYEFNIVVDPNIDMMNVVDIDYKIVPINEIREVRNRISVTDEI